MSLKIQEILKSLLEIEHGLFTLKLRFETFEISDLKFLGTYIITDFCFLTFFKLMVMKFEIVVLSKYLIPNNLILANENNDQYMCLSGN